MYFLAGVLAVLISPPAAMPQALTDFMPIGVRYRPASASGAKQRRLDLQEMQRLHFNVVLLTEAGSERLCFIDRLLAGAPYPGVPAGEHAATIIPMTRDAASTRLSAWTAIARGARGVIFEDWTSLGRNHDALKAASEFAEAVTRNAPLYSALRPRTSTGHSADVRVDGGATDVAVRVLESPAAFVIIALNTGPAERTVTMTFSPELPEAIWQNMMTGNTLSFVMRDEGPTYSRTFAPKEVLVLMINNRLR